MKRIQDTKYLGVGKDRTPLFVEEMDDDEPPQAPDIYLFPPTIHGFSLRRKLWSMYFRGICCVWKLIAHSRSGG
jgi:hypothetical protein